MKELKPLANSIGANEAWDGLRELVIRLWKEHLCSHAEDINVYGFPFEGSDGLIIRSIKSDGIANFDTTQINADAAQWLLKAARYRNQKRGIHLLRTFIKCTWGPAFEVFQLWQLKSAPYPTVLKTEDEITQAGESLDDYFLTSRLRIDFGSNGKLFPSDVRDATRGVLPARLFLAQVRRTLSGALLELGIHTSGQIMRIIPMTITVENEKPGLSLGLASSSSAMRIIPITGTFAK